MYVVVNGGAITASEDISHRIFSNNGEILTNITIGDSGVWTVQPNVSITIAAAATVTVKGCIQAPLQHIFMGLGLVRYNKGSTCSHVHPEWWGARGDGVTPNQQTFFTLASEAIPNGGTVLGAGGTAHYVFTDNWFIRSSFITFDGRGALFTSSESDKTVAIWAHDGGTQAQSGETAQFLHDVHLRNYRIGSASTFPDNQMRGGRLFGCVQCSIENVTVRTSRGTAFTTHRCQECRLENIRIEHGSTVGGGFCTLLVHSNNTLVENWYCTQGGEGTGPCCSAGLQVKGGVGNKIINATVENVASPAGLDTAFWTRGDAPTHDSNTDPDENPYPFLTNGALDCKTANCYSIADDRRQTIGTEWANITVRNATAGKCMAFQEGQGDTVNNLHCDGVRLGVHFAQIIDANSTERNFVLNNFEIKNIGVGAANGDGLIGVYVDGAGTDSGLSALEAADRFRGIRITNGRIQDVAGIGLLIDSATDVIVQNVTVMNASRQVLPTDPRFGMQVQAFSRNIKLTNNHVLDNQGTPTITAGIRIGEDIVSPVVSGNSIVCPHCDFGTFFFLQNLTVGRYTDNVPGDCTARTTDATPLINRCNVLTHPGDMFQITAKCAAHEGLSNEAYYERTALVKNVAGTLTVHPNSSSSDVTMETETDWEVDFSIAAEKFNVRFTGGTGQTVDWLCSIVMVPLVAALVAP
jgi:hypothetical protein